MKEGEQITEESGEDINYNTKYFNFNKKQSNVMIKNHKQFF